MAFLAIASKQQYDRRLMMAWHIKFQMSCYVLARFQSHGSTNTKKKNLGNFTQISDHGNVADSSSSFKTTTTAAVETKASKTLDNHQFIKNGPEKDRVLHRHRCARPPSRVQNNQVTFK